MAFESTINIIAIYQILKRLVTPFKDTKAYELGIIDNEGKLIKKPKDREEKKAYSVFDRFIFNLKRMLNKIPGGNTRLGNITAALYLLRENAPVNNIGSGNIALPKLPGFDKRTIPREIKDDRVIFEVDDDTWHKCCRKTKNRYHKFAVYIDPKPLRREIRKIVKQYPEKSIILKHAKTNNMAYFRFGRGDQNANLVKHFYQ